jgi:hypothetical protein
MDNDNPELTQIEGADGVINSMLDYNMPPDHAPGIDPVVRARTKAFLLQEAARHLGQGHGTFVSVKGDILGKSQGRR